MKNIIFLLTAILVVKNSSAQDIQAKERAEFIAKESFSKSKYKKMEKYGVTKEMSKVIISTPVIKNNIKDYSGVYKANGPDYTLTLNVNEAKNITGTIKEVNENNVIQNFTLKNITIDNALFKAIKVSAGGTETALEGVFIDKNDNGNHDFGLGIKLPESVTLNNALHIDKVFFKKVN